MYRDTVVGRQSEMALVARLSVSTGTIVMMCPHGRCMFDTDPGLTVHYGLIYRGQLRLSNTVLYTISHRPAFTRCPSYSDLAGLLTVRLT